MLDYKLSDKAEQDLTELSEQFQNIVKRFVDLITEVCEKKYALPQKGKPEPLKQNWNGWWSKRLTEDDRIIYRISKRINKKTDKTEEYVEILRCKGHYNKKFK
jgi:toxin YoeB